MISLPKTKGLQELLDPILGWQLVQLVRLVLGNQEQKLYGNCAVTVPLLCDNCTVTVR